MRSARKRNGNTRGRYRKSNEYVRAKLGHLSDKESYGHAPSSDSDTASVVEDEMELDEVDSFEWQFYSKPRPEFHSLDEEEILNEGSPSLNILKGLLWENALITEAPGGKMEDKTTTVKEAYQHLFMSPIDAALAMLPYIFWEVTAFEINHYNICS
jgi:hypothetical protein